MVEILKNKYFPFIFVVPLFFCCHQYNGVISDAILYVTQYLNTIDPSRFVYDPAFEFGNQDSLGLFSPISKIFLGCFGVECGAFVYSLLMDFLWIIAACVFTKSFLKLTRNRLWLLPSVLLIALAFANAMPFSRVLFFKYVECYYCSRMLSIALGMLGLAFVFAEKKIFSLLVILIGAAIHPITAGWCLPFWMLYFFPRLRVPIIVFSAVFPFSFLFHYGAFDFYPKDWLSRPLEYFPTYLLLGRYFVLIVFFWLVVKRFSKDEKTKKISAIVLTIFLIALYWHLWGGLGEHVFLYQVQTWRAAWIPSMLAIPLYVIFAKNSVQRYRKEKSLTTYDCALALIGVNTLASQNVFVVSVFAAILLMMKPKNVKVNFLLALFVTVWFLFLLVQQYHIMVMQGLKPVLGFDYVVLRRLMESLLFCQLPFVAYFVANFVRERKYVAALPLIIYCFASQFVLLPFLAFYLAFVPSKNRWKFWLGSAFCLLVVLFEGIGDVDLRCFNFFEGFPRKIVYVAFFALLMVVCFCLLKRIRVVVAGVFLLTCSVYACLCYDARTTERKVNEKSLDKYVEQSIFPNVKDRGRILFYVDGFYKEEPKIQFLTGSYYTKTGYVGEVFYKGQYKEVVRRDKLLLREDTLTYMTERSRHMGILGKLSNPDTLIDRTRFLCSKNEISHLVTHHGDFPFVKEDSTVTFDGKKVYLYGCN